MNINTSGTLTSTSQVVPIPGLPNNIKFPATSFLTSSDSSRKIEFSVDGGATYFTPTYDQTLTGQIVVAILSPISTVRFTGISGDKWGIL